jgi:hypothetical protein
MKKLFNEIVETQHHIIQVNNEANLANYQSRLSHC